jgi:elongation factor Ts
MYSYIGSYVHKDGELSVLVELRAEDSFTVRTEEFQTLARDLAMHVAACSPTVVSIEDLDPRLWAKELERNRRFLGPLASAEYENRVAYLREVFEKEHCLLKQPFVKNDRLDVGMVVDEVSKQLGAVISVARFVRFKAGEA